MTNGAGSATPRRPCSSCNAKPEFRGRIYPAGGVRSESDDHQTSPGAREARDAFEPPAALCALPNRAHAAHCARTRRRGRDRVARLGPPARTRRHRSLPHPLADPAGAGSPGKARRAVFSRAGNGATAPGSSVPPRRQIRGGQARAERPRPGLGRSQPPARAGFQPNGVFHRLRWDIDQVGPPVGPIAADAGLRQAGAA
jgi:hypothetical protein